MAALSSFILVAGLLASVSAGTGSDSSSVDQDKATRTKKDTGNPYGLNNGGYYSGYNNYNRGYNYPTAPGYNSGYYNARSYNSAYPWNGYNDNRYNTNYDPRYNSVYNGYGYNSANNRGYNSAYNGGYQYPGYYNDPARTTGYGGYGGYNSAWNSGRYEDRFYNNNNYYPYNQNYVDPYNRRAYDAYGYNSAYNRYGMNPSGPGYSYPQTQEYYNTPFGSASSQVYNTGYNSRYLKKRDDKQPAAASAATATTPAAGKA